ncbi:MAG: putative toxin-antitoxin system toxin component, PIN family [Acidobacteriaceae bacterium]
MRLRVVFDTTTVVSAMLFANGSLAWLRAHWRENAAVPLISGATATELSRVLGYAKFQLSVEDRRELLADYVPYCEVIKNTRRCPIVCRDAKDQPFLDLAYVGKADLLVSGDQDLLAVAGRTKFSIETPGAYKFRVLGA